MSLGSTYMVGPFPFPVRICGWVKAGEVQVKGAPETQKQGPRGQSEVGRRTSSSKGSATIRGLAPLTSRVAPSVLHDPDGSQTKQIVVAGDERQIHDLSRSREKPVSRVAVRQGRGSCKSL